MADGLIARARALLGELLRGRPRPPDGRQVRLRRAVSEHRDLQHGLPLWAVARVRSGRLEFWRLPRAGEATGIYWTAERDEAWAELDRGYAQMVHTALMAQRQEGIFLEIIGHAD